jgi:hypothetical protein
MLDYYVYALTVSLFLWLVVALVQKCMNHVTKVVLCCGSKITKKGRWNPRSVLFLIRIETK